MLVCADLAMAEPGTGTAARNPGAKPRMQIRSFSVRHYGRLIFTVHARTLAHAQAIVSARLSDLSGITLRASRKGPQR